MRKILTITVLLLLLGLTLNLSGCGWYGCNYPGHGDTHTRLNHNRIGGDFTRHNY